MAWSIILLSICEVAKEDAAATKRRADRLAERKREEKGGDLTNDQIRDIPESAVEDISAAFSKVWRTNAKWAQLALTDAILYAARSGARSSKPTEEVVKEETARLFYQSLWSSLQGRGWKEETNASGNGKIFRFGEQRVSEAVTFHQTHHHHILTRGRLV